MHYPDAEAPKLCSPAQGGATHTFDTDSSSYSTDESVFAEVFGFSIWDQQNQQDHPDYNPSEFLRRQVRWPEDCIRHDFLPREDDGSIPYFPFGYGYSSLLSCHCEDRSAAGNR